MSANRMKTVLVCGATGFLGPALVEELVLAGFQVVCGVRDTKKAARQLPFAGIRFVRIDLNSDLEPEVWLARLRKYAVDLVVNNVGVANSFGGQSLENVNLFAPLALFRACQHHFNSTEPQTAARIIQISTTGVDWPDCDDFAYPASKRILEQELGHLEDLPHIIIRPNVIYEPERGHLLLEQIARIPIIFHIGHAPIQPVHCREVAIGVARLAEKEMDALQPHLLLRATGPDAMTWKEVFATSAAALNRKHLLYCPVPLKLAQLFTFFIQQLPEIILYRLGILSKMDPQTIVMMTRGSTGSNREWLQATGLHSIRLADTYQHYGRGREAYTAFIDRVRRGID